MSQSDTLSVLSSGEVPKPPSFRHHELDPPLVRGAGPGLGADAATRQPSPATGPSSRLLQTGSWIRSVEEFASLKQNAVILPVPGEGTSRGHLDGGGGTDSLSPSDFDPICVPAREQKCPESPLRSPKVMGF